MDLALNILQKLIFHKTQKKQLTNQPTKTKYNVSKLVHRSHELLEVSFFSSYHTNV